MPNPEEPKSDLTAFIPRIEAALRGETSEFEVLGDLLNALRAHQIQQHSQFAGVIMWCGDARIVRWDTKLSLTYARQPHLYMEEMAKRVAGELARAAFPHDAYMAASANLRDEE